MGQIRGRSRTWRPARGASRFRTLPVSLSLINRPGGGQGPELREERACSCPIFSRGSGCPQALQPDQEPDPEPEPPPALTLGLSKAGVWAMVPSVRPSAARSAEGRSVVPDGSMAGPLLRGPAVTAARHAPLNGAQPRPRRPGPAPAPAPSPEPPPPPLPIDRRAAHFLEFLRRGVDKPESPRSLGLPHVPGPGPRVGATCGLTLQPPGRALRRPGPSCRVTLLPGRLHVPGPSWKLGNLCASQTSWGSHSTGQDITLIAESHNRNV